MANSKHIPALTSTWDHEADHEAHGAGEEDDPDDPLHDGPAVFCDVLETVERGLGTVTLALFCQPRHLNLGRDQLRFRQKWHNWWQLHRRRLSIYHLLPGSDFLSFSIFLLFIQTPWHNASALLLARVGLCLLIARHQHLICATWSSLPGPHFINYESLMGGCQRLAVVNTNNKRIQNTQIFILISMWFRGMRQVYEDYYEGLYPPPVLFSYINFLPV